MAIMTMPRMASALALAWAAAGPAQAVVFDESQVPGGAGFTPTGNFFVGTLDPGANAVTGALGGVCQVFDCNANPFQPPPAGSGNSQDSFSLTVPAGSFIEALTVTTSSVIGPAGFRPALQVFTAGPVPQTVVFTQLPVNATSANLVTAPLGPGTYRFAIFGQTATAAGPFSLNYAVDLTTPIPEPATWLLMAGGVAALARRRRR